MHFGVGRNSIFRNGVLAAFMKPCGSFSSGKDGQVALRSRRVAVAVGFPSVADANFGCRPRLAGSRPCRLPVPSTLKPVLSNENRETLPSFAPKHSAFCMVSAPSVPQSCETLHFVYRMVVQCDAKTIFCRIMSPHSCASFWTVLIKEGLPSADATGISRIQGCRVALPRHLKVSPRRWLLHQIGIRHDLFAIRIPTRRVE